MPAPPCPYCGECVVTVKHVLIDCRRLGAQWQAYFKCGSPTLKDIVGERKVDKNLFKSLRCIGLYDAI